MRHLCGSSDRFPFGHQRYPISASVYSGMEMVGAVRFEPGSGFSAAFAKTWKGLSLLGLLTVGSFEAESYFHR